LLAVALVDSQVETTEVLAAVALEDYSQERQTFPQQHTR
jgi:hypothetical protein